MEKYYIGLDGGSTYLKAAMIKDQRVIDTLVRNTGIDNNGTAERLVAELCERNRVKMTTSRRSLPTPTGSGSQHRRSTGPA